MKCDYCENEATCQDFRTEYEVTSKVLVCGDCFGTTDDGIKDKRHEMAETFKELFTFDEVDNVLEKAWGQFWDTVNGELFRINGEQSEIFKEEMEIDPHSSTLDEWSDKFIKKLNKKLKKNIL